MGVVNPFENPDSGFDEFPLPDDLPESAGSFSAPKAGPWDMQNFAGQMTCAGFSMPLWPDRDRGESEVLDNSRTVIGTGLTEDTAPLRMAAVPGITGRYAGNVGGEQDGIPMAIESFWQLITDEWITGYLRWTQLTVAVAMTVALGLGLLLPGAMGILAMPLGLLYVLWAFRTFF